MENMLFYAVAALTVFGIIKALALPLRAGARLGLRLATGFSCLWLLNAGGLGIQINPVTVALSAFLGLPGIALAALLGML